MRRALNRESILSAILVLSVAFSYYFSNPSKYSGYSQAYTIAGAMLEGHLGVIGPRGHMEFVPGEDRHYSVLPLGAVLCMLPAAALAKIGVISRNPSAFVAAVIASLSTVFALLIARAYQIPLWRRFLLVALLPFGTWMWCNLAFAGAWQLALGFAVMGQLGAIYYLLIRPNPLLAGFFFAIAFGNRFELLVIAPVLPLLLLIPDDLSLDGIKKNRWQILQLAIVPAALVVLTMIYNYARFYSPFELGHMRLAYQFDMRPGLFDFEYTKVNLKVMLYKPLKFIDSFPFIWPTRFGESIFLCCPFLFLLFWPGRTFALRKAVSWLVFSLIFVVLVLHGNAGAVQFGYRYGMSFLPWFFLILLESADRRFAWVDLPFFVASVFVNAVSVYAFYWVPRA